MRTAAVALRGLGQGRVTNGTAMQAVVGEEALSAEDLLYLELDKFERKFVAHVGWFSRHVQIARRHVQMARVVRLPVSVERTPVGDVVNARLQERS